MAATMLAALPLCRESWLLAAEDMGEGVEWELSSIEALEKKGFEIGVDLEGNLSLIFVYLVCSLQYLLKQNGCMV